ncbi:hypothetical protein L218DRAFT_562921 [Marasmius fiardii PR-910]|nr:hypothetical protein L218DRAFT_562921 [Marasmius fiardii PR-910]
MKPVTTRRPSTRYLNRDGFREPPVTLSQKEEVHAHALNVLRFYSVPPPSVDEILSKNWSQENADTSTIVNEQIEDLEKRHSKAIAQLCDLTVTAYQKDRRYRNMSYNALLDLEPTERKKSVKEARGDWAGETVFTVAEERGLSLAKAEQHKVHHKRVPYPLRSVYSRNPLRTLPTISRLRHSYLKRIIPMKQRRDKLKEKEEEAELQREYNERRLEEERMRKEEEERRRKAAQLPQSLDELKQKSVEMQRRVAKFLCSGGQLLGVRGSGSGLSPVQEKMLKEWNWTVEEVAFLRQTFANDATFASQMQAMNIANETIPRDPRNRK